MKGCSRQEPPSDCELNLIKAEIIFAAEVDIKAKILQRRAGLQCPQGEDQDFPNY